MAVDTIPHRLLSQARTRPGSPAYYTRASTGTWTPTDWATYASQVRRAARALITLGVAERGSVCILGFNRPEWVIIDVATMAVRGAPAGIYTTSSPPEVQYIIHHAESKVVVVENAAQYRKVQTERDKGKLPNLQWIVLMAGADKPPGDAMLLSWEEFNAKADLTPDAELDRRMAAIEKHEHATFIYTSGTTGPPKAVMLSMENLTWTADCARGLVQVTAEDASLSYLPLSHIAEQMFTLHVPISVGFPVYFCESIDRVVDNLKEVKPTVMFGVPRIWEKMYSGIAQQAAGATGAKKAIMGFARATGLKWHATLNAGRTPGALLKVRYAIANKFVFSKVKAALGFDRIRVCVSGAAPISKEIIEFFSGFDIMIREVYGQSEDTGPTTFNVPRKTRIGSVGPSLPGVEVKIAADEEILVKGPNVFLGYYKDEAATRETLVNGWLHSGDLGKFDADGFLWITGRKKEIIITAGGKNIAPKNIEGSLRNHDLISQAVVIGDRRKFLSAILTLNPDSAKAFATANGIPDAGVHQHPKLLAAVQKVVDEVNKEYAQVEWIRKFTVLESDFTIDGGEFTPTLKVKRKVVAQKYAKEIEAMYEGAGE